MNDETQSKESFHLNISAENYMRYYQGSAQAIVVKSESGKILRFPANFVRQFLTHSGIYGYFHIIYDKNNKLISIEKISD